MKTTRRIRVVLTLAAIAATALALSLSGPAAAKPPTIHISGKTLGAYKFKPATLHVSKGAKVHWSWSSNAPHNVTFRKLGKHSKTKANGSFSLKFKKKGTFHYVCTIHDFTGKIVVG